MLFRLGEQVKHMKRIISFLLLVIICFGSLLLWPGKSCKLAAYAASAYYTRTSNYPYATSSAWGSYPGKECAAGTYGSLYVSGDSWGWDHAGCGGGGSGHPQGTHFNDAEAWVCISSITDTSVSFWMRTYSAQCNGGSASCSVPGISSISPSSYSGWHNSNYYFSVTIPFSKMNPGTTYSVSVSTYSSAGGNGCSFRACSAGASVSFRLVQSCSINKTKYSDTADSGNPVTFSATAFIVSSWKLQSSYTNTTYTDVITSSSFSEETISEGDISVICSGTSTTGSFEVSFPFNNRTQDKYYRLVVYAGTDFAGTSATSGSFYAKVADITEIDVSQIVLDESLTKMQAYTKNDIEYEPDPMLTSISITARVQGAKSASDIIWQYRDDESSSLSWTDLVTDSNHVVSNGDYNAATMTGTSVLTLKEPGEDVNRRYRVVVVHNGGTLESDTKGYTCLVTPKIMKFQVNGNKIKYVFLTINHADGTTETKALKAILMGDKLFWGH